MNIFCTVGSQLPFDRLVRAVSGSKSIRQGSHHVCYQIGVGALVQPPGDSFDLLGSVEYLDRVKASDLIIAHAGMGSILTALELEKPILVLPRRGDLMETRNDHQLHTAIHLQRLQNINVAMDELDLERKLHNLSHLAAPAKIGPLASSRLISRLQSFIDSVD